MLSFFLTHFPTDHDYPFLPLSLVGSYQVGYTRSHPNTEVKMLRACSVPLCSHRRERQVIYLFVFFLIPLSLSPLFFLFLLPSEWVSECVCVWVPFLFLLFPFFSSPFPSLLSLSLSSFFAFLSTPLCFLFLLVLSFPSFPFCVWFHGVAGYHITFT